MIIVVAIIVVVIVVVIILVVIVVVVIIVVSIIAVIKKQLGMESWETYLSEAFVGSARYFGLFHHSLTLHSVVVMLHRLLLK